MLNSSPLIYPSNIVSNSDKRYISAAFLKFIRVTNSMLSTFLSKKNFQIIIRSFLGLTFLIASMLFLASCSFLVSKPSQVSTGIIDADDPNIRYIGRFYAPDSKTRVFDWPGIQICAKFQGTSCSVRLTDMNDEYAIIIDHRAPRILTTDSSNIIYKVASGLADSVPHSIIIQKRTEPVVGKGVFSGFILDEGAKLLPPERSSERRIEFIGNSITCGYGVEGDSTAAILALKQKMHVCRMRQ